MIYAGLIALFIVQRTNSRLDEFLIDPSSAPVAFIIKRIVSSIFLSLSFSRSKIRANYEETRASHDQSRKGSTSNGNPLFLDSPPLLVPSPLVDRAPSRSSTRAVHPPPRAINVISWNGYVVEDARFLRLQRISRSILDNQSISTVVELTK